ncbi:unnamed protein product, partial [Effrenium voratum]
VTEPASRISTSLTRRPLLWPSLMATWVTRRPPFARRGFRCIWPRRRLPASGRKPSRPATRSCASACRRPKPAPRCSGQIKA